MPINNIPGVGPTNADIATAVAAPSAATIAAAVAAPSAATIAAAVAAPSAATIAAAVAAPSSSTIATAVAAAVPTLTQINNSVASNASPYGGTWATLASVAAPGTSSLTISGLSGYKYLQIVFASFGFTASGETLRMRFNGDASGVYYGNTATTIGGTSGYQESSTPLASNVNNLRFNGMFEIRGSNSSSSKMYSGFASYNSGSSGYMSGIYDSSTAISSINFFTNSGSAIDAGRIFIRGAN